ncbi:2-dehydropantoate 2-reductase [Robiginitomaculum antarcticum]|uniref:2-dehydropantoate 2-reductase n=1 Tax=Robiginitomaculum antarcticum TaxID=437507 RepID=UPI0003791E3B|nr:2-dehydropantoate 2-reductase [Robiginitomaculum antarcticum]
MTFTIGIFGAGAIGSYIGGYLAASGEDIIFLGRPRGAQSFAQYGLTLTHFSKPDIRVTPEMARYTDEVGELRACDVIFITVKSQDTAQAAAQLAPVIAPQTLIISLQNGVGNTDILAATLGGDRVFKAMIPNNVLALDAGRFHMGTEGEIAIEDTPSLAALIDRMKAANLDVEARPDMAAAQWTKLLMNLSNAGNTLAGLTIYEHLRSRDHRRVLALSIDETLAVLGAANIAPPRLGKVNPKILAPLLRLPDFIYHRLMPFIIKIDPQARSSMAQDLIAGKDKSEIDALNGAVIALGHDVGLATPVNDYITARIKAAFAAGESPKLSGAHMLAQIKALTRG